MSNTVRLIGARCRVIYKMVLRDVLPTGRPSPRRWRRDGESCYFDAPFDPPPRIQSRRSFEFVEFS